MTPYAGKDRRKSKCELCQEKDKRIKGLQKRVDDILEGYTSDKDRFDKERDDLHKSVRHWEKRNEKLAATCWKRIAIVSGIAIVIIVFSLSGQIDQLLDLFITTAGDKL